MSLQPNRLEWGDYVGGAPWVEAPLLGGGPPPLGGGPAFPPPPNIRWGDFPARVGGAHGCLPVFKPEAPHVPAS